MFDEVYKQEYIHLFLITLICGVILCLWIPGTILSQDGWDEKKCVH